MLLIAIEGEGELDGQPMRAGEVWHVASSEQVKLAGHLRLLRTSVGA